MKRTGKANQNARGRTLETLVFNWATFMSATGSVHGLSWFNYFEKPLFKGFVLTFALGCFCFIPTYFYLTLKDFLQDDSIFTKEVDRPMELVEFPHVTVCHPFYFDKEKMMALPGMTNETLPYFASFLISSLDLSMYELDYRNTDNTKEEHTEMLHNFEDLAQTMLRGNTAAGNFTSLLDIMKYSAVSCDSFLFVCFLRSRKYSAAECCAEFFSPAPFFTTFGTCYTMNSRPVSEHPGAKDELIFYVWTDQARSPLLHPGVLGTSALSRMSPWYALTTGPPTEYELQRTAQILPQQFITYTPVRLEKTVRTELNDNPTVKAVDKCRQESPHQPPLPAKDILPEYNLCWQLKTDQFFDGCTALPYYGMENIRGLDLCTPSHLFRGRRDEAAVFNSSSAQTCLRDCEEVKIAVEGKFVGQLKKLPSVATSELSALTVYVKSSSMKMKITTLWKKGVLDFIADMGGMMGLTIGASIFSFIEIFGYVAYLARTFIQWIMDGCRRRN